MNKGVSQMSRESLDFFFYPKSVAIVGASSNPASFGCDFMKHILDYGYRGIIYPINHKQPEIFGIKAYPDLLQVPGTIDYVICCIAVSSVPSLLDQCARKGVKGMHILAGRGAETGRAEARALEAEILRKGREYGIRIIGPNCLGITCPESGLASGYNFPKEPGGVSALIQSGGNSTDLIHIASLRGLRFNKVVSYGNALDINEMDLLAYFADDPKTRIVLGYIEGLKGDGREFLKLVRDISRKKPIIICKGGRTTAGARMTVSHTATLAGSGRIWETAMRQFGAIPVRHIDELVNLAVAFSFLPTIKGKRVGIAGCGGGRSILSVDAWEENGFVVPPLPDEIRQEFKNRGSQVWDWIANPADVSIILPSDPFSMRNIAAEMVNSPAFDFVAADAEEDPPFDKAHFIQEITDHCEGYIEVSKQAKNPIMVIFDERSVGNLEEGDWNYTTRAHLRSRLVEEKVPFFPSVDEAAKAVSELIAYYQRRDALAMTVN